MFSNHNRIKSETITGRYVEKSPNIWKLNNILLNNPQDKEEINRASGMYFKLNEQESVTIENCGMSLKEY